MSCSQVPGRMGFYKQQAIEEQDRELSGIGSRRAARVSAGGGDAMSNSFLAQLDLLIAQGAEPASEPPPSGDAPDLAEAAEAAAAEAEAESLSEGQADQALALERGFERQERAAIQAEGAPELQAAPAAQAPAETPEQKARRLELSKAVVGAISTEKMVHGSMILNGICTQCVRCRLKLTDAVSIERGMGPECSSKGYAEDPTNPDEMGAMIELAEYPALVDFLTLHYKPLGVRGLMNGLVRIAALNRKSPVHGACANAIEMLGYQKLAGALRDALVVLKITRSEKHAGHLKVWVRGAEWTRDWSQDCYSHVPHSFYDRQERGLIVADRKETKSALWRMMMKHYPHECASTPTGTVRIPTEEEWRAKHAKKQ
jgi:hypothetical protein